MSMYSVPRPSGSVDNSTGHTLPASIIKIREKRNGGGATSADSDEFSKTRDSQMSKSFVSNGGAKSIRLPGDSDLVLKTAPSGVGSGGTLLKGMGRSTQDMPSSMRLQQGLTESGSRSQLHRRGASRFGRGSSLRTNSSITGGSVIAWGIWALATVALTVSFVLIYWLEVVVSEQDKVTGILLESATVVSASFFAPITAQLRSFDASMGAGLIASSADFPQVSATAFPLFQSYSYLEQAEFLFNATDTLRVRPAAGPTRVISCLRDMPDFTNSNAIPTLYIQGSPCSSQTSYCQFSLLCESSDFVAPTMLESTLVPFLFSPPESPQKKILAISMQTTVRVTASLPSLTIMLEEAFPTDRVFVVGESGAMLGSSQPDMYPPISIANNTLVLAPTVYGYSWSFLLPKNFTQTVTSAWSSGVQSGWECRMNILGNGLFVLVITESSEYTNETLHVLGYTTLVISLLPAVYLAFVGVIELVRSARLRYRSRLSYTN